MADSAMSNSHAHITTISQTSITLCGRRNHSTISAARLRHHTVDTTTIMLVVYRPPLSSTGSKSCPAVTTHVHTIISRSTAATDPRIAALADVRTRLPPLSDFASA